MAGYTHNSSESPLHGNDHINAAYASPAAPPNNNSVPQLQANNFEMQNMFYNGVHHMQHQNSTQSSAGSCHLNQSGHPQQLQWDQQHSHHQNQNSTMAFVANNSAPFSSIPRNLSPIPDSSKCTIGVQYPKLCSEPKCEPCLQASSGVPLLFWSSSRYSI